MNSLRMVLKSVMGGVLSKNASLRTFDATSKTTLSRYFLPDFPPFELSAVKPSLFNLKCQTGTFQEAFPLLTFALSICKELKAEQNNNELLSGLFVGKM